MAINKNFVIKNGIEVAETLIFASSSNNRVGIGSTIPTADFNVDGNSIFTGIVTALKYYGDGGDLTGIGDTSNIIANSLVVVGLTTANDEEIFTQFNIVNQGTSAFRYQSSGIGFVTDTDNPDIYINRGKNYRFNINAADHPFYIKSSPVVGAASSYNSGVVGNGATVGVVTFKVPFDAPNTLYYQCSNHSAMNGHIYVLDAGIGTDVSVNTSGIITASNINVSADLDVDGLAELDDVNVSGASTFVGVSTFQNDVYVDGNLNVTGDLVYDEVSGRNIYISGVSTFGTVQISNGQITSTSGVVTYYGDGSNLTGIATQLTATIGLSSDSTLVGTGVTLIDFVQGDGQPRVEVTSVDVTSGVGTVVVAPGISVGLAIALGS
jgi:hypothetical protein